MQTIKEKLSDMNSIRKAKNEAKQQENVEKELAKARMEVAHEVRMAREAEAEKDHHINKAAQKAAEQERKHPQECGRGEDNYMLDSSGQSVSDPAGGGGGYSTDLANSGDMSSGALAAGTGNDRYASAGATTDKN